MIDIFTYKIFYFTVALLVGFLIGYFLKKDSYEEKIKENVKNYEKKYEETIQKLKSSKENLTESETRLNINKDLLQTQVNIINKLNNNILAVKQKNLSIQDGKKDLDVKLDNIKNQIKKYEKEINEIKPRYSAIENNINKYNNLITEYENLSDKKNNLAEKVYELSNMLEHLSKKIKKVTENNKILDDDIYHLKKELKDMGKKENLIKSENLENLTTLIEDTRVKFLNYKYKYEDLKNKISNNINIDKEDIDNFILKNEEQRLVDKMLSKLTITRNKK